MIECRSIQAEELTDLIKMVSESFNYPENEQIDRDFPLLFNRNNFPHLWTYSEYKNGQTKILSHAGSLMRPIYIDNRALDAGAIGGVATVKDAQGKGYARELVKRCLLDLKSQGAALAFLWTGDYEFYRPLGFELGGRQWLMQLPLSQREKVTERANTLIEKNKIDRSEISIRVGYVSELSQVPGLLQTMPLRVERKLLECEQLLKSEGITVISAVRDKRLLAYLVIDKGIDLKNHIHEWAGDEASLMLLLDKAMEFKKADLVLISPQFTPIEAPWIYHLEEIGFETKPGFMSMIKILNYQKLEDFIKQTIEEMGIYSGNFSIDHKDGVVRFSTQDKTQDFNVHEFIRLIFGPDMPSTVFELPPGMREFCDGVFPLRAWWWGLDSV